MVPLLTRSAAVAVSIMTDVVAAIGLVQMQRYKGMLERRRKMIERYDEALKPLNVAVLNHYDEENFIDIVNGNQ